MTELHGLLTACLTSGDDTPRLVLADFLEERMPAPDWQDRAAMIREGLLRSETERRLTHDLYGTEDLDAPDSIKDSNGEVALGLCRRCRAGERELFEESCNARLIRRRHEGPCETCVDTRREGIGPFGDYSLDCPTCVLATRTRWDRCPCPCCNGRGEPSGYGQRVVCHVCGGSGDLLLYDRETPYRHEPAPSPTRAACRASVRPWMRW